MNEKITQMLSYSVFNNHVSDYLIALGIFIGGAVFIKLFDLVVVGRIKSFTDKTETNFDNFIFGVLERALVPLFYFGSLYFSLRYLTLPESVMKALHAVGMALIMIFGIRFVIRVIQFSLDDIWYKRRRDLGAHQRVKSLMPVIRFALWIIGVLFLLDNLGFRINSVMTGLGIGGIAVALAAQALLGDLFSYFSIMFDRPFEIGDFIIVGDYMGTIEHVGIKTTRVRSLGGEQLIFSNTDLTGSRVRNYKRMDKRRVVFPLGVTYETSSEKLKEGIKIIKEVIKSVSNTVFDRCHFMSYGDFSLNIEVVYYVLSGDYNKYMDIQQDINFKIKKAFEEKGIEFAYPTQTLFVQK